VGIHIGPQSFRGFAHSGAWRLLRPSLKLAVPETFKQICPRLEISSTHNPLGGIQNLVRQELAPFDGEKRIMK
jgi:hypothetical protein